MPSDTKAATGGRQGGAGSRGKGPEDRPGEVTRILEEWRAGDESAPERLFPVVYDELRRVARGRLRRERAGHALQPTALVHEAFLRLVVQKRARVTSRAHFLSVAAQAMRRVLIDEERKRRAAKRGAGGPEVVLYEIADLRRTPGVQPDLLDLHRALDELALIEERQSRLVVLRFFGGLTTTEAAEVQGVSVATAERDWTAARLWLRRRLAKASAEEEADDG
jgi:RNA polymerase sigma factor (TIGR02999 family)